MAARSVVSPHDQSATFVELFFDLVFVFGITQVVGLLYHDLTWLGAGRSILVFWLLWWAWTQFTWAHSGTQRGPAGTSSAASASSAPCSPIRFRSGGRSYRQ